MNFARNIVFLVGGIAILIISIVMGVRSKNSAPPLPQASSQHQQAVPEDATLGNPPVAETTPPPAALGNTDGGTERGTGETTTKPLATVQAAAGGAVAPAGNTPGKTSDKAQVISPAWQPEMLAKFDAIDKEQQTQIAALLDMEESATPLPDWIKAAAVTNDGKPVFYTDVPAGIGDIPAIAESALRFSQGKSSIVRGARVLLNDSHGRLWVSSALYRKFYYVQDGQVYEPRLMPPELVSNPNKRGRDIPMPDVQVDDTGQTDVLAGQESADGVVRFFGLLRSKDALVASVAPDGTLECHDIAVPHLVLKSGQQMNGVALETALAAENQFNGYLGGATFVPQDGGLIAALPHAAPITTIVQFDGSAWQVVNIPAPKGQPYYSVVAARDGSLLLLDSGKHLNVVWPPATMKNIGPRIEGYIADLDDDSFEKRRAAFSQLVHCGPMARELLNAKLADASPEQSAAIKQLLEQIDQPQGKSLAAQAEDDARYDVLYGGRYWYRQATVISGDYKGQPLLLLSNFLDGMGQPPADASRARNVGPSIPKLTNVVALALVQSDGELKIVEQFTPAQLAKAGWGEVPTVNYRTDGKSQVWVRGKMIFNSELQLAETSGDSQFNEMAGFDDQGRLYAEENDRFYVVRPEAKPRGPQLAELAFTAGSFSVAANGLEALCSDVGVMDSDIRPTIYHLGPDRKAMTSSPVPGSKVRWLLPTNKGQALAAIIVPGNATTYIYYDGQQWSEPGLLPKFVVSHSAMLAKFAPQKIARSGDWFLGDGANHMWFSTLYTDPDTSKIISLLAYFDGKTLHDVYGDIDKENRAVGATARLGPTQLRGGVGVVRPLKNRTSLLVGSPGRLFAVHYDNGKYAADDIKLDPNDFPDPNANGGINSFAARLSQGMELPGGDVWFTGNGTNRLARLHDNVISLDADDGIPLLGDSQGRLWYRKLAKNEDEAQGVLYLKAGDARAKVALPAGTHVQAVAQGQDGRIWLLAERGLYSTDVQGAGASMKAAGTHFWAWPSIRTGIVPEFFDAKNGLWLYFGAVNYARVQLPTPQEAAAAPVLK